MAGNIGDGPAGTLTRTGLDQSKYFFEQEASPSVLLLMLPSSFASQEGLTVITCTFIDILPTTSCTASSTLVCELTGIL